MCSPDGVHGPPSLQPQLLTLAHRAFHTSLAAIPSICLAVSALPSLVRAPSPKNACVCSQDGCWHAQIANSAAVGSHAGSQGLSYFIFSHVLHLPCNCCPVEVGARLLGKNGSCVVRQLLTCMLCCFCRCSCSSWFTGTVTSCDCPLQATVLQLLRCRVWCEAPCPN